MKCAFKCWMIRHYPSFLIDALNIVVICFGNQNFCNSVTETLIQKILLEQVGLDWLCVYHIQAA